MVQGYFFLFLISTMASHMDENVRSYEEEIRHFPCGTTTRPRPTTPECPSGLLKGGC